MSPVPFSPCILLAPVPREAGGQAEGWSQRLEEGQERRPVDSLHADLQGAQLPLGAAGGPLGQLQAGTESGHCAQEALQTRERNIQKANARRNTT